MKLEAAENLQTKEHVWAAALLAVPFIVMIAATGLNFRLIGDESIYIRIIQKFAAEWPAPDISNYSAGSTPLMLLILAAFGKLSGFELWKLRLVAAFWNYCAVFVFYRLASRIALPSPLISTFILLFFPYVFFHGFTIYNDSLPMLLGICALWYFLEENPTDASLLKGSLFATLAVCCRQTYLVLPAGMILFELWNTRSESILHKIRRIALLSIPFIAFVPVFLLWGGLGPPKYRSLLSFHVDFSRTNYVAVFLGAYFLPHILAYRPAWRSLLFPLILLPAYFAAVPAYPKSFEAEAQMNAVTGLNMRFLEVLRERIGNWCGDAAQFVLWLCGLWIFAAEVTSSAWDQLKAKLLAMFGIFLVLITITPATTDRYFILAMPILIILLHRRFERRWVLIAWMVLMALLSVAFAVWQIKYKSFEAWGLSSNIEQGTRIAEQMGSNIEQGARIEEQGRKRSRLSTARFPSHQLEFEFRSSSRARIEEQEWSTIRLRKDKMQETPTISVVIVAGELRERAGNALRSVLSQDGIDRGEVVLVDTYSGGAPVPGCDHPSVRVVPTVGAVTFGDARALGVQQARGVYVAFLEDHSLAHPGWINAIIKAFDNGWAGVGPEIHNGNKGVGISDIVWLMNYQAEWRPPARFGSGRGVPGHNSSFRRDALLALGSDLRDLLQTEVLLHWRLQDLGHTLGVDPAVKVAHIGETSVKEIVVGFYIMHRFFGHARAHKSKWSAPTRLLRILATPLVPCVRFLRFVASALGDGGRPGDLKIILRFPHVILLTQSAAAIGMAVGFIFGPGESGNRFLEFETSRPRGELSID